MASSAADDDAIIDDLDAAFSGGGHSALNDAYRRHGSLVYTYCVRAVGTSDAADVTQEVFVSAWRAQHRFDPSRGTLAGWLITIAKSRSIDHWRRRRLTASAAEDVAELPGSEDEFSRLADRLIIDDALASLPSRQRTAVILSMRQQMTHDEIAEFTGVPLGTVKSDLRRSIRRLAAALRHDEEVNHA